MTMAFSSSCYEREDLPDIENWMKSSPDASKMVDYSGRFPPPGPDAQLDYPGYYQLDCYWGLPWVIDKQKMDEALAAAMKGPKSKQLKMDSRPMDGCYRLIQGGAIVPNGTKHQNGQTIYSEEGLQLLDCIGGIELQFAHLTENLKDEWANSNNGVPPEDQQPMGDGDGKKKDPKKELLKHFDVSDPQKALEVARQKREQARLSKMKREKQKGQSPFGQQ